MGWPVCFHPIYEVNCGTYQRVVLFVAPGQRRLSGERLGGRLAVSISLLGKLSLTMLTERFVTFDLGSRLSHASMEGW